MTNMIASIHGDVNMVPAQHCECEGRHAKCGVGVPSLDYASFLGEGYLRKA
jgi:hypothetical protein